jgi:nucleoside-diphosphate-sugar epimerase
MRCLVTGANGFVGSALLRRLHRAGDSVIGSIQTLPAAALSHVHPKTEFRATGDIGGVPPWDEMLPGVEVVIHLAALVHQMGKVTPSLDAYRRINVTGTTQLANACVRNGVRRLVFLSSIKVNGERTPESPFTETAVPHPSDAYGVSKLEAEEALTAIARASGMEVVLVRPPLVYGPGVRANFRRLLGLVARLNPLAVPGLTSKRSMISVDNLADFLRVCAVHPSAANQLFLISDNDDVTVSELMRRLAREMNKPSFTIPASEGLLRLVAKILGKEQEIRRIIDPLTVSPAKAMNLLDWNPPVSLDAGLARTVQWYLHARNG